MEQPDYNLEVSARRGEGRIDAMFTMRVRDPFSIVIFGASGDLTRRKLMPALYTMFRQGLLPDAFRVIGFARREWTDESFRERTAEAVREFSRIEVDEASLAAFCARVEYHRGEIGEEQEPFETLREKLDGTSEPGNRIFYLSIKPDLFESVIRSLSRAGCVASREDGWWSRFVIEKPFGRDGASARALNEGVRRYLSERQIFRIDHYLGKETVQNVLSFRFANTIFEPLFNSQYIDMIQITAAETTGMESGRGAYYDASGAVRDMVQNHLLQLLCLVTMEPPSSMTAEAIRNEKVKVLQSIVKPKAGCIDDMAIRAQYTAGESGGHPVPGYLEEERVPPESKTETYAAVRLSIENWRWAGVPMYLRTGKRLKKRATEIVVHFKRPPLQLFQTVECVGDLCDLTKTKPNQLIFRIQPDEGISLRFSAKRPVMQLHVENVDMRFSYEAAWESALPEAYERLLLDLMRGDSTLFTRSDETEAAWDVIDPILKAWHELDESPLYRYEAGTWGPVQAEAIFRDMHTDWHNPR
jgi:glucose-6-phosphate 1-dehydrogenase